MLDIISKVSRNGHITIPSKIREYLHIKDGDLVRIGVTDHQIVVVPSVLIDKDQEYYFTQRSQKQVRESEEDFKKGKYSSYTAAKDLEKEIEGD